MSTHDDSLPMRPAHWARAALGGVLMGLANLVPGISGGTMLLAAGIYPRFVDAVAAVSTLRLRAAALGLLAVVAGSAGLGILLLAGSVKDLVVEQRWVMYSLFIGLTLGGVPVVWRLARPWSARVGWGALGGFVAMAALALAQSGGASSGLSGSNFAVLFVAGLAGASAMILPGVSGGYLLLVLGQYVVILGGIDRVKEALSARDLGAAMEPALSIMLPVGLGVLVGIVLVSNLLRWLLLRHEKPTLGALLGLLVGAVVGLWPFRRAVEPVVGETLVRGQTLTAAMLETLEIEDLPTETFDPTQVQILSAVGLALAGFLATALIARIGRDAE